MKTKLLTLLCTLMCVGNLFAYDFYVDGIYYNKLGGDSVEVTYQTTSYYSYSGSVTIPETVTYSNTTYRVTTIGSDAFRSCNKLASITIPNSVTTIGSNAFEGCSSLTKTNYTGTIADWCKIKFSFGALGGNGANPMSYSHNLYINDVEVKDDLVIPEGVEAIGDLAFYSCSGLTSVTIPNSVTTIGEEVFYGCINLEEVKGCQNVVSIGNDAFTNTLWYLDQPDGLLYVGKVAYKYKGDMPKDTHITIKDGTLGIAPSAFYNCIGLTSITIPNSVTTIGSWAFYGCKGLTLVTIPNSVTTIGNYAFDVCTGMTSVTIGNSVTTIGKYAFCWCSGLTSITIPNSVTKIGDYAFDGCTGMTSVTIGNSVTAIGSNAFEGCSSLTSVTIGNSVTTIGSYAFKGCSSLTKTNYTGTIADWCKISFNDSTANPILYSHNFFINDAEVKNLIIPEGVESIGGDAFRGCIGLTSVTIPNSVTSIGWYAFHSCSGLTSVTINSNAICSKNDYYGRIYFSFGSQVPEYILGNSVTTIGDYAFDGCSGLTSVTIPSSVTAIGSNAFNNCPNLTKIVCEIEKPLAISDKVFSTYSGILYVPAKGVNRYKLAEVWKKFKTILPIQAEEVIVTETQVNPSANIVSIAWRAVENAYNYIIVIKQGEDTICKLTFNAEGQLVTSQYYAPQRARLTTSTTDAEQTATGWRYVIRDLEPGTEYTYSIVAYDETDKAIDSQSGTFRTLLPSGLEDLTIDKNVGNKFIYGNQLYIRHNGNLFTATGARVK